MMEEENLPVVTHNTPEVREKMPVSELYEQFKYGNPNTLDTHVKRKISDSVSKGNSFKIACASAKIPYSTFKTWMKKGEKGIEPYFDFYLEMEQSASIAAEKLTDDLVVASSKGNIGAAQWLLARLYPELYGANKTVDIKEDKRQEIVIKGLPSPNNPQLEKKESKTIEAKYKEFVEDG